MIFSMTGYGRGEVETQIHKVVIEMKSVNHRYSEVLVKMPKKLNMFEDRIKNMVKNSISRGRLEIFINFEEQVGEDYVIKPNFGVIDQYVSTLNAMKERYNIKEDISLSLLARYPDALTTEYKEADEETVWKLLSEAMEKALATLMEMRKKEGDQLADDVLGRVRGIQETLEKIEAQSPQLVEAYQNRLTDRIKELINDVAEIDEAKIVHEVAIFADKTNIAEEVVRLRSHFVQIEEIFKLGGAVGRKLDFLIQEMNREINTIGSKSPDLNIANAVIDVKSEIEKIREQVQNIE